MKRPREEENDKDDDENDPEWLFAISQGLLDKTGEEREKEEEEDKDLQEAIDASLWSSVYEEETRQAELDTFYQEMRTSTKYKTHYQHNQDGHNTMLAHRAILTSLLCYASLETMIALYRSARHIGEAMEAILKGHHITSLYVESLDTFQSMCFMNMPLFCHLVRSIHTLRFKPCQSDKNEKRRTPLDCLLMYLPNSIKHLIVNVTCSQDLNTVLSLCECSLRPLSLTIYQEIDPWLPRTTLVRTRRGFHSSSEEHIEWPIVPDVGGHLFSMLPNFLYHAGQ